MEGIIAELQIQRAFMGDRAANLAQENHQLRQQVEQLKAENDRLKKAVEEKSACDEE